MKRLFLFTMMCLFGLFSLNAQTELEVIVGADGSTTSTNKLPTYEYYNYSSTQQIYTAEDMQDFGEGVINSVAFRQTNADAVTRNLSVYMANTELSSFEGGNSWMTLSSENLVFSGQVTYTGVAGEWLNIEFTTPFEYEGGNLLVCVLDNTGTYLNSGKHFDSFTTGSKRAIYHYRDTAPYDVTSYAGINGYTDAGINVVKFSMTVSGEIKLISVKPNTIELGARPNGAWTEPFEVQIKAKSEDLIVSSIESTNEYFELPELEFPMTIQKGSPLVLEVAAGSANEGDVEGQLEITYATSREVEVVPMTAYAYEPAVGDVYENAQEITSYPFTATHATATLYNNYTLPGNEADGYDVVYKINIANDGLLTAAVNGANAKVAVYTSDFDGEAGPMANNNYNGIQVGNASRASQISAMTIPAGEYYLVASSTGDFTLDINVEAVPAPEKAYSPYPYDQQTGVSAPTLDWEFGANTVEYQLLLGTAYPPKDVIVDWTSELEVNHYMGNLYNNKNYFWQVNARNSSGTTYGDIWVFTTTFNEPQGLAASSNHLYEGESTTITWNQVQDRSHRGYNVYVNNQKVNKNTVTETSYTLDNLEYDMYGYYISVSAVYDEGESNPCDGIIVYVTGETEVAGNLYEQDKVTPLNGGVITVTGTDEFGAAQSYTFVADENGAYTGTLLAGEYTGVASVEGYQNKEVEFTALYDQVTVVDYALSEVYNPVKYITATETEEAVELVWGMQRYTTGSEDFESGDFSVYPWNNEVSEYPFAITTDAYEGEYAMKSTCEGIDYGVSAIE
ncbi:MAG: hypothetical protein J6R32_02865, partial [Bacteroidales bacterium]|nr:hypothetical protein [Bacteroidales bacterium]